MSPMPPQQQTFPFALYQKAKDESLTRIEKFGDYHHVLIQRFDPESKKVLPPFTSVLSLADVQVLRDRHAAQLESIDALIKDLASTT